MTITFLRYVISRIIVIEANVFNQFNWSCSRPCWTLCLVLELFDIQKSVFRRWEVFLHFLKRYFQSF